MTNKRITLGILAHVDAGKTTLSEALLYSCGAIRQLGRVDHKDTFLDTDQQERDRGITIFSKQAELDMGNTHVTLLDTPGHVDFSAEMERTLGVLDYAILVVSGKDGVQGHTVTLWQLLAAYQIPTFIWVNKMDMEGTSESAVLEDLKANLGPECVKSDDYEQLAMCSEALLDEFLATAKATDSTLAHAIATRQVFPCYFGSALKQEGIDALIDGIDRLTETYALGLADERGASGADDGRAQLRAEDFGAKVFKITRDARGERLTHIKIVSGTLAVKDSIETGRFGSEAKQASETITEKVNQIRIYSGDKYRTVDLAQAGDVCQVAGWSATYAGQGLGLCEDLEAVMLEPVLSYGVIVPEDVNIHDFLGKLRLLEEEDPQLHVEWNEQLGEIQLRLMGEIQLEIVKKIIIERLGVDVDFTEGKIAYKETISAGVDGYGHFEPLRHYAEVRVRLEPLPRGSGIQFETMVSEDVLDRNWQRLIFTHFGEKDHLGALIGAPITDLRIILVDGRAHLKHTEGGDFRQATYRAIRNALRRAAADGHAELLEPWYDYDLSVPSEMLGRAINDIQQMGGSFEPAETVSGGMSRIIGKAPVAGMRSYAADVASYTKGYGHLSFRPGGYDACHNADEVISEIAYDADRDVANTADSVFCSHGAGVNVPWDEVKEHAHVSTEDYFAEAESVSAGNAGEAWNTSGNIDKSVSSGNGARRDAGGAGALAAGIGGAALAAVTRSGAVSGSGAFDDELQQIFEMTYGPEKRKEMRPARVVEPARTLTPTKPVEKLPEFLLVDGYNIIFAWEDLRELARINIDSAREALVELLKNFAGTTEAEIIAVFDAYRVSGGQQKNEQHGNIWVIYTAEAESADTYIERTTFEARHKKHLVRVATADVAEQIIVRNNNAIVVSPAELRAQIDQAEAATREWLADYKLKLEMREKIESRIKLK